MRVVCISDTHGRHEELQLPEGDVLVHAGDFTKYGNKGDTKDFSRWLRDLDFRYKIVIAGNHDFCAQTESDKVSEMITSAGGTYLQDSGVEIEGMKFYGSPWTPKFFDWAFMKDRGKPISAMWDKIPDDTQVLVTHGPPRGILDPAQSEPHAGCDDLRNRVTQLKKLDLHVSGHLHEGFGTWSEPVCRDFNGTLFVNAAQLDDNYQLMHWPIVVDL
jgi:Icc-related predicted phosphoesterase